MSDVFILGAGFSKEICVHMPVLGELGEAVRESLGDKLRDAEVLFPDDLEMWLTYLSQNHPWLSEADNLRNRALFLDISSSIGDVLHERMAETLGRDCPEWLHAIVNEWHRNKSAVLTLNYDTTIERASRSIEPKPDSQELLSCENLYPITLTPGAQRKAGVIGGNVVESFRLYKLHGSINWFYSGSQTFYGEAIYYVPVSDGWVSGEDVRARVHAHALTDKAPFIVPPLLDKLNYFQHETVRSLWSNAAQELRNATRVFCLGYSFPETDLTMKFLIHSNAPIQRTKFYVVNTDKRSPEHFRQLLPESYDPDTGFVGEAGIPRLVDAITSGSL